MGSAIKEIKIQTGDENAVKNKLRFVNGKILDSNDKIIDQDFLIEDGIVTHIGNRIPSSRFAKTIDLKGQLLVPGFVDIASHLHSLQYPEGGNFHQQGEENPLSLAMAGARGGYTSLFILPTMVNQRMVNVDEWHFFEQQVRGKTPIHLFPILSAVTHFDQNLVAHEVSDLAAFKKQRQHLFYATGEQLAGNSNLAKNLFSELQKHNGIFFFEGDTAALKMLLPLAYHSKVHLHILSVANKEQVELIRAAKANGQVLSASVTPHHLILSEEDVNPDIHVFKSRPIIGSASDREALLIALLEGTIDIISAGHCPFKEWGPSSLETTFPLLYTSLVLKGRLSLQQLLAKLTHEVVGPFNLPGSAGLLREGVDADFAVLDLSTERKVLAEKFLSAGHHTYLINAELKGWPVATYCKGHKVFGS